MGTTKTKNKARQKHRQQAVHTQTVHFEFFHAAARKVCLAGTFNNWKPETDEMIPRGNGTWVKDLTLAPGTYEYRLVVDGSWVPDPGADHVTNPFGERNSLLTVPSPPSLLRR